MNPRKYIQLLEVRANSLFHATNVITAAKILKQDRIELTFAGGTQADNLHRGKRFYLSCSRNPANDYVSRYGGATLLVLDADKLRQRFEIVPTNYWGDMGKDEQEDRLWAHVSSIPAKPYVVGVHCLLHDKPDDRPDVHNTRSYKTPRSQAVFQRLHRLMRQRNARSVKELVLAAQEAMA